MKASGDAVGRGDDGGPADDGLGDGWVAFVAADQASRLQAQSIRVPAKALSANRCPTRVTFNDEFASYELHDLTVAIRPGEERGQG